MVQIIPHRLARQPGPVHACSAVRDHAVLCAYSSVGAAANLSFPGAPEHVVQVEHVTRLLFLSGQPV